MRATRQGLPLVDREVQVLALIAKGGSYAEIAVELHLARASVKNYAHSAIKKLGARSQAHAVHLAHLSGILRRERHGDHAGFVAHTRRGEEPCGACWAGEREYRAELRRKRLQEAAGGRLPASEPARGDRDGRGAARPPERRTTPPRDPAA